MLWEAYFFQRGLGLTRSPATRAGGVCNIAITTGLIAAFPVGLLARSLTKGTGNLLCAGAARARLFFFRSDFLRFTASGFFRLTLPLFCGYPCSFLSGSGFARSFFGFRSLALLFRAAGIVIFV